jgi:outer membrane protein assembly factor BamB
LQERDKELTVHDAQDGRTVRRIPAESNRDASVSPDGQYLVSYAAGLFVYEFATGKLVRHFNYPASTFAFLGSGIIAVVDEDNRTIRLHRLRDDSEAGRIVLGERFGAVTSLAASADASRVLVGTERGVVLVFGI